MKILFAVHGFPPELVGGVELQTRELAFALARAGHAVQVVAGTLAACSAERDVEVRREFLDGPRGERIEVARIARRDLYFDHWHKSLSAAVAREFRELLRELRPEVVHVQHWLRLSRDLVTVAAREGIPSVITLHDSWASCPIVFRVRPDTHSACEALVGPHPCVPCAGRVPPRTPWIPVEGGYVLLAERQRDIAREIELARAVIAPSSAHARALERHSGRADGSLGAVVIAPCPVRAAERTRAPAARPPLAVPSLALATWSQIARHKGVDLLIEAFLAAREQLEGEALLRLEIHGSEAEPEFAARLRASTHDAPVRWCGAYPHGDPGARLDPHAELFVSATRAHESYGASIDEAARLGLALLLPDAPVFVERCSGVADFYAQGDAASLTARIVRFARDPQSLAGARRAATEFAARTPSAEAIAHRHEELYARAISAGAPPAASESWFAARMSAAATLEWDRALAQRTRQELGL